MKDWRPEIAKVIKYAWPDWQEGVEWIASQVSVESRGDPLAISPVGAKGLLQLMPNTALEVAVSDIFDPLDNLRGGITYLKKQYDHLGEIPDTHERLLWSFASYNAGRGYINRALKLSLLDDEPFWWKWNTGKYWLMSRECSVARRFPDYKQAWNYVRKIVDGKK